MIKLVCLFVLLIGLSACGGESVSVVQAEASREQGTAGSAAGGDASGVTASGTDASVSGMSDDDAPDENAAYVMMPETADAVRACCDPNVFVFSLGGNLIEMDQNMDEVIAALGEPMGVFEAPSCAFDGIDRVFRFPGVQIHTYPLGDSDFVHTISLRDDTVATVGGIFLGQTFDDVVAVYGSDFAQEYGMVTFTRGLTTLSFLVENNIVIAITYGLILDM